jgi:hypothetical protein
MTPLNALHTGGLWYENSFDQLDHLRYYVALFHLRVK